MVVSEVEGRKARGVVVEKVTKCDTVTMCWASRTYHKKYRLHRLWEVSSRDSTYLAQILPMKVRYLLGYLHNQS
jgi:hypothetical protein